jgi:multicomponent Na+:H+ antiporter subunit B
MHAQIQPYNLVLRIGAKMLIPLILVFALYVQFHGESGPGGGFQAGVIFAAAFILYALVFGMDAARSVASERVLRLLAALGVLLYYGVGLASLLAGGNFLDYDVLAEDGISGQHLGIFLIELGIGITVATVMVIIFFTFAERGVTR